MIKIEFYIPTKTQSGKDIDRNKVDDIIAEIWPKYLGGTKTAGTGFYHPPEGPDEIADCHVLSIVTEHKKATVIEDLKRFKEKIKTDLDQQAVLITWHFLEEVW